MINIENIHPAGWEPAIRGMRNPMNSWEKSDSFFFTNPDHELLNLRGQCPDDVSFANIYEACYCNDGAYIGPNDLSLMKKLTKAGPDHRKFMRMIVVYMDITAPLYWWKEFETYKVGTVSNSCSTMHKIAEKEFTKDDFSCEHLIGGMLGGTEEELYRLPMRRLLDTIGTLNEYRRLYLETHDKNWWWQLIQLLPSSYNQRRTVMLNYEVLHNIYTARKDHKLDEWRTFCQVIKDELPYSELITGETDDND